MLYLILYAGIVFVSLVSSKSVSDEAHIYDYKTDSIKGVALGGWLVLEPYITPSLFYKAGNLSNEVPLDEEHLATILTKYNQTQILKSHWNTFINETDFETISGWGLDMVRIPVGYWAFELIDGESYISGQEEFLDNAIEWAENNDLKVWIDLHGVPGSQNGFDNSGLRDHIDWQKNQKNVNVTLSVLDKIFQKYGNNTETVIGIEIVNEPLAAKLSTYKLKNFYQNSYKLLRDQTENNLVIHDAFEPIGYWDSFMNKNQSNVTFENIIVDHHHYEVFDVGQLNNSIEQHIQDIVNYGESITSEKHPAVVGEWSAALTDCVYWLNGVGRGARFDGTYENNITIGDCSNVQKFDKWSKEYKQDTRRFIELQLFSYGKTAGWIFWTYKTEDTIDWDMKRLIEYGLFPQPLDNFTYNTTNYLASSTSTSSSPIDISSGNWLSPSWMVSLLSFITMILV